MISSKGLWFQPLVECTDEIEVNCVKEYNKSLLDPTKDSFRYLLNFLVVVAVFIDILCYKWRKLANYLLYLECLTCTVATMFPNVGA